MHKTNTHTNTHTNTFNNTLYSIQKRVVFLLCIVSALMSASLWSMTASAAAPVAVSHILSVQTYAGGGNGPDSTSDGASTQTARFDRPNGLRVAPDGRLFVTNPNHLRVVSADGSTVSTYAGGGSVDVDSASTSNIRFRRLLDVAIHPDGRVFVLDGGFALGIACMLLTQLAAPPLFMRAGDQLALLAVLQMVPALPLRALTDLWGWRFTLMDGFSLPIQPTIAFASSARMAPPFLPMQAMAIQDWLMAMRMRLSLTVLSAWHLLLMGASLSAMATTAAFG